MSEFMSCCKCCLSFIFSVGLSALFLWLSLCPSLPTFSIQNFYVPALNTTTTTTGGGTTVAIDFIIDNSNKFKGIYYDDLNIALYYAPNLNSFPVGNDSMPGFYQGHKKKATKKTTLQEAKIPRAAAVKTVSSNGTVSFRVDLGTKVRYKIVGRKTRRHKIKVQGDVSVDKQGKKTHKKSIKLKSAAHGGGGCNWHCFYRVMASSIKKMSTSNA
ncbi:protein NDR1-like [Telopea speciosissima]|uniref:protein NDR1-like n=1 Tax=Telopea speciosissima TaxID=54955 RepID=UPI001CC3CE97|nr:protein NDR1-like [Telopea speciosissima]